MGIKETKALIAGLDETFLDEPVLIETKQYATAPETLCTVADLKALADSHTALLEAARGVLQTGLPHDHEEGCKCVVCLNRSLLVEAIEQAEGEG
jgi:hypothetical protein